MALEPDETVIKETGRWTSVVYVKGAIMNPEGALILTNKRLVFTPGKWQSTDATILVLGRLISKPETVQIPLNTITKVEKGFGEQISIYSDKKYDFRGMSGTGDWVTAIEQAKAKTTVAPTYTAPIPPQPSPVSSALCPKCHQPISPQNRFCPNCGAAIDVNPGVCPKCGAPIDPSKRFCGNCGAQLR